jgi:hypothetical protein
MSNGMAIEGLQDDGTGQRDVGHAERGDVVRGLANAIHLERQRSDYDYDEHRRANRQASEGLAEA